MKHAPMSPEVAAVFDRYPAELRERLLELRSIVLDTAATTDGVGVLEEALRWGEPAYLTTESGSGSTVRIGPVRGSDEDYALYFNCRTSLVESFRDWFPGTLRFDGKRAVLFRVGESIPVEAVSACVSAALTYHRDKSRGRDRKSV